MAFRSVDYKLDVAALEGSFGMALRGGRLVATVVSRRSGKHITVQVRAKRREGKQFRACGLTLAERIYLDVPAESGSTEIGALHLEGKWADKIMPPWSIELDEARVWAARRVLDIAQGRAPVVDDQAEILEGKICLMCGRELTDPESIKRNIGPECWRQGSDLEARSGEHQRRGEEFHKPTEAEVIAADTRNAEEEHAEAHMGRYPGDPDFDQVVRVEDLGRNEDTREQIEAELQQTVKAPANEEVLDTLPTSTTRGDLVTLRIGEDPAELLAKTWGSS